MMRAVCLLSVLLGLSCVTSQSSVTRNMLAPLPAMPLTMLDDTHRGQVELAGQVHPLTLKAIDTTSGLGAPLGQGDLGVMVRVATRVAVGGQVELASASNATYAHPTSPPDSPALGLRVGAHVVLYDGERFGLDASGQVSLHLLPISVTEALPLAVGATLTTAYSAVPGLEAAVLPRVKTGAGTFFAGVSIASSPDITLAGTRTVYSDGTVNNGSDAGVSALPMVMAGAGWALSLASGFGLKAQVWVPLTRGPIGYGPIFGLGLQYAAGDAPAVRKARKQTAPLTTPPLVSAPDDSPVPPL
jgi:hypothetical protein